MQVEEKPKPRIAVLHTRLSGYFVSCLRELHKRTGCELLIFAWPPQDNAPFDSSLTRGFGRVLDRHGHSDDAILEAIASFAPDLVLTSGWVDKGYVRICRRLKAGGVPIVAGCDTQYTGRLRQRVASVLAPWYVGRFIDVIWVTGERQRLLADRLGFIGRRCWDGYYACDWHAFSSCISNVPKGSAVCADRFFLYVGRYVSDKGIDTLAEAYREYRRQVRDPWRLVCAGVGPLRSLLLDAGAQDLGFVQPESLPELMAAASTFVLPSRYEPWGVVAQEASASGLPLILSDACGAGVHLLRHLHNGYVFPAGSAEALAQAMVAISQLADDQVDSFGRASFELSKQYTPARWAETLIQGMAWLKGMQG